MPDVSPLAAWDSFYVIIGSSAAALTGLMFVVISLIPESGVKTSDETIAAYGTPTVVHFCAVLLVSASLCAPWPDVGWAGLAIGAMGVCGAAYVLIALRRARHQTEYRPVMSDWLWHTILPLAGYAALVAPAATISDHPTGSLFVVGAATILLLFIGIHNAWDTVTFVAISRIGTTPRSERADDTPVQDQVDHRAD
jgi:hypothetical protein